MSKTRAYKRKYHFIYKTTCKVTGKYYYGMHSTDDLEDGYLGSGKIITRSINKHGKENHKIERLEFLDNREDLRNREEQIVNEELIQDKLCMNLQLGGGGGFVNETHEKKFRLAGALKSREIMRERHLDKFNNDLIYREKWFESLKSYYKINGGSFKGKKHSKKTKEKMRLSQQGKQVGINNSQYGKCWITNNKESKKIYKGDTIPEGWRLGRKMGKHS